MQVWSTQARDLETARAMLVDELAEQQASLAKATEEFNRVVCARDLQIEELKDQAKSLEIGVQVWSKQASDQETTRASLMEQLAEQQTMFAKMSEEFESVVRARESHIAALINHTKGLETGVQVWSKEARALEADRATAKQQLQKANEELTHIYQSRSWRLTSPMRAIRRYFTALPARAIHRGLRLYQIAPLPRVLKKLHEIRSFRGLSCIGSPCRACSSAAGLAACGCLCGRGAFAYRDGQNSRADRGFHRAG